jgi:hypothetical protein
MSSCLHATDFRLYNASFLRLNAHLLSLFFLFFYIIVCIVHGGIVESMPCLERLCVKTSLQNG